MTSFCKTVQLSKHKSFEIQLELGNSSGLSEDFFEFKLSWTRKQDHAGPLFRLSLLKLFWLNVMIYDHRHWNYDEDRWYESGEDIRYD